MKSFNLQQFIKSEYRNLWIKEPKISVYVRKNYRFIDDCFRETLDLANVEVVKRYRGRGVFTSFLDRAETAAKQLQWVIYVECIMEPRLIPFLRRRGYKQNKSIDAYLPISLYKL